MHPEVTSQVLGRWKHIDRHLKFVRWGAHQLQQIHMVSKRLLTPSSSNCKLRKSCNSWQEIVTRTWTSCEVSKGPQSSLCKHTTTYITCEYAYTWRLRLITCMLHLPYYSSN